MDSLCEASDAVHRINGIHNVNRRIRKMKNYTITVNGNVYDVTVEEKGAGAAPQAPRAAAPATAPKAAPAAPKAAAPAAGAGSIQVKAGAAGKVFKLEASVGQSVKKGDAVVIIEAMKMEIPVVAPEDGTVASIDVAVGDAVESGAVLATLN
jgi:glutaconyl-CoA/methylmalonyl-CoA decarboxylase subunit gamma